MSSSFETRYISEPELVFGSKGEEKDPRIGLKRYGPYYYSDEEKPLESVRVGIIGNRVGIDMVKRIIETIKDPISSPKTNKWLYPDYPGMKIDSPFKCSIKTSKNWEVVLTDDFDLKRIESIVDVNQRIAEGVKLYVEKINELKGDDEPDVVLCVLPKLIEEYCGISEKTRGAKKVKMTPLEQEIAELKEKRQGFLTDFGFEVKTKNIPDKSYDFRNSLKGKVMESGIPTQIIRSTTCEHFLKYDEMKKHTKQDPSSMAWNFSTAIYYKANGKPWRLAKLRMDTCYVGVSFFVDKLHPKQEIQISMAQVFTHNGEGLVLRGTEVEVNEHTKQAHLKKDQAKLLLKNAIEKYISRSKRNPSRVVIHKKSQFSPEEQEGFNEAIYEFGNISKDFVTIKSESSGINFLRMGAYPVLRGTMISLDDDSVLLYSSGFSPRIRTYAGHRIPNPLTITHIGNSSKEEIAEEILGLTKLNWNTTSFSTFLPITLSFADEVGKVLSELPKEKFVQDHYRFFM